MSIKVSDNEPSGLASFSMGDTFMPELSNSKPLVVEPKKNIEKKKEVKPKFFYELLQESYDKGIFNRGHSASKDRTSSEDYNCPILCVAEMLGMIDKKFNDNHEGLADEISSIKQVKPPEIALCCPIKTGWCAEHDPDFERKFPNEPLLAQHIAYNHGYSNKEVANIIRAMYEGKKHMLPKEEDFPPLDTTWQPRHITFSAPSIWADRTITLDNNITYTIKDISVSTNNIARPKLNIKIVDDEK